MLKSKKQKLLKISARNKNYFHVWSNDGNFLFWGFQPFAEQCFYRSKSMTVLQFLCQRHILKTSWYLHSLGCGWRSSAWRWRRCTSLMLLHLTGSFESQKNWGTHLG
jgi:hypothetical protein